MIDVQLMLSPPTKTEAPPLPKHCAMVRLHPLIPVLRVRVLRPRVDVFMAHARMAGTDASHVLEPMLVPILLALGVAGLEVGVLAAIDDVVEAVEFAEVGRAVAGVQAGLRDAGVDEGDAGVQGGGCGGAGVKMLDQLAVCRSRGAEVLVRI